MKYSRHDKLQALKRSQAYRHDYEQYQQTKSSDDILIGDVINNRVQATVTLSPEAKKLCRKWGLRYPFDPEIELNPGGKWFTVDLSFFCGDPVSYLSDPSTWRVIRKKQLQDSRRSTLIVEIDDKIPLLIDPTADLGEILEAVKNIVQAKKKAQNKRKKQFNINIWRAYDLYEECKNYSEVTRAIFNHNNGEFLPNYNPTHEAQLKAVKRAIKRARQIITTEENKAATRAK